MASPITLPATYGYIAYDVENGNLVYLKDFWRVDHPDIQKEGDVYRELHEAEVPNIAEMDRAGYVPLIPHHDSELQVTAGAVQRTRTQDYVGSKWSGRRTSNSICIIGRFSRHLDRH